MPTPPGPIAAAIAPGAGRGARLRGFAAAVVLVLWAVLAHLGSTEEGGSDFATLLGVAPILAAAALLLWRRSHPALAVGGTLLMFGGLVGIWPALRQDVALLYFVQHVGVNLALAALFGRSLLGSGEALITRIARIVHQSDLSPRKRLHTRQATAAWTLFFLANALVSVLLYLLAPLAIWSIFANLLAMPLLGAMFAAEHLWRIRVLPPEERPTIAQIVHAWHLVRQREGSPRAP